MTFGVMIMVTDGRGAVGAIAIAAMNLSVVIARSQQCARSRDPLARNEG
jgi:hypothetical protein